MREMFITDPITVRDLMRLFILIIGVVVMASCSQSADNNTPVPAEIAGIPAPVGAQIPIVALKNSNIQATEGAEFTVNVVLTSSPLTEGGGLVVRYSPDILQAFSVAVNDNTWDFVSKPGSIDNETGVIENILFSSFRGASGDAPVATIRFKAQKPGAGVISLEKSKQNPFASNGKELDIQYINSTVNVVARE